MMTLHFIDDLNIRYLHLKTLYNILPKDQDVLMSDD